MDKNDYENNEQNNEYIEYIDISSVNSIENIKEEYAEQKNIEKNTEEKSKKFILKILSICLITILGGIGIGLGLSIGYSIFYNPKLLKENKEIVENINNIKNDKINDNKNINILGEKDIVSIIKNIEDSVVSINVNSTTSFFNRRFDIPSAGSGIIFYEDEKKIYVVTNSHVVEGANGVTISIDDDIQLKANFVGNDQNADIAVISINKKELKKYNTSYKIAEIGNSNTIEVGEKVIAIGNALGQGKSATTGIISVKNKQITIENKTLNMIQTDAAINQGNSGGALVNLQGEVIGINTAKLSGNGIEGMGYAIPSEVFKPIIYDIVKKGSVKRPYIGIRAIEITEELKIENNLEERGIYILSVEPNGSAYLAGIRTGDIIINFNNKRVLTMEDLQRAIKECKIKEIVPVDILREPRSIVTFNVEIKDMNKNIDF